MTLIKTRARGLKLDDTFAFTGTVSGAGGITMADQWRLTTSLTGSGTLTNMERVDTRGFSSALGTGMSHSSGVFTFPSTGFYYVQAHFKYDEEGDGNDNEINGLIEYSSDGGSNYSVSAYVTGMTFSSPSNSTTLHTGDFIFDITNTSNDRVRFGVSSMAGSNRTIGNTNSNETWVSFLRLADT
jgi:hypothetical protein